MTLPVKYTLTAVGIFAVIAVLYLVTSRSFQRAQVDESDDRPDTEATLLLEDLEEQNAAIKKAIDQLPALHTSALESSSMIDPYKELYELTHERERALDSLTNVMVKIQDKYSFKPDSMAHAKIKGAMYALLAYDHQKEQTRFFDTLFFLLDQKTAPPDTTKLHGLMQSIRLKDSAVVANTSQASLPFSQ